MVSGTHDCDRQLRARLRPCGDDNVERKAFDFTSVSVWETCTLNEVKLTVLGGLSDPSVKLVHDQINGLLDPFWHGWDRKGLLRTSRPKCGCRMCAVVRVHRDRKAEAEVPCSARRTKSVSRGPCGQRMKDHPRRFREWNAQEPVDFAVRSSFEATVVELDRRSWATCWAPGLRP